MTSNGDTSNDHPFFSYEPENAAPTPSFKPRLNDPFDFDTSGHNQKIADLNQDTSYLNNLNPEQRKGVEASTGPVLVLAGAGSGKTKMLTTRIVHLIRSLGVRPDHILAVTFTNKAAGEMRERASHALGLGAAGLEPPLSYYSRRNAFQNVPTIGTFHSICTRILRTELQATPFKSQFVIYDDSDQLQIIKECFAQLGINEKNFSPKSFQYSINEAKCSAKEPHQMEEAGQNIYAKNLNKVYELYQKELFKNNAVDFGEIITMTYRILRDNPDILEKYQEKFQFIHVDEYQDTNRAQYLLIHLLAEKYRNLCVVGDEDQSIYKWRGADIRNILDFEKDYPDAVVVKLEQNYRSTQTIISASSEVIANNKERKKKVLWTDNEVGEPIRHFQLPDDRSEAEMVAGIIKKECSENELSYNEVALFYRTNAQSRIFEDILRRERIPYKIIGGLRFYDRKEVKDILAYFRILCAQEDSISFKRVINVPARSIGKTTVEKIEEYGFRRGIGFEQALREAADLEGSGAVIENVLNGAAKRKVADFIALVDDLRSELSRKSLAEIYHELLDRTRYVEELKLENTEESLSRIENLQEFESILVEFENQYKVEEHTENQDLESGSDMISREADFLLPLFLENVALVGPQESEEESPSGTLSLMTLHTSKGLEFPLVFLVGLEEGLFPSIRPTEMETEEDIEEERRLCYVGMTRAKQKLVLTNSLCRRIYGNIMYHEPSRFLDEIPKQFVVSQDLARHASFLNERSTRPSYAASMTASNVSYKSQTPVPSSSSSHPSNMIGQRVKHPSFGVGNVLAVEGSEPDTKVTIEFAGRVVKKFILRYVKLEYL